MQSHADENTEIEERRGNDRPAVNLQCEIRVGTRAWRKAQVADLTPGGFQVQILDMPPMGTPVYVRMANLQMMHAEVCWTKVDTAGCKFLQPLNEHVYNHILNFIRA
ncbi:PilZ domain-containing protein [Aurantiacibacter sp. D1-12]|uniref:PilZ domain-containing protein n=1 Tax=Aurantiacibacter sp. D1-12 TaxID=2993658 RepID=UPI00237CE913|nr:PilZ domain-containing protein [Aurantiacibacter sp. D1-12]MDE1467375.1 hypothetical protein [Aurantiacibacter sp. D1-12]